MTNLSKDDIQLIKSSYRKIQHQEGFLAEAFYRILFRNSPEARGLFPKEMGEQLEKFTDMLDFLVNNLSTPWVFTGRLRRLAKRHVGYGAEPEHFALVGTALLAALDEMNPVGLNDKEKDAWRRAYGGITQIMIEAAYPNAA